MADNFESFGSTLTLAEVISPIIIFFCFNVSFRPYKLQ